MLVGLGKTAVVLGSGLSVVDGSEDLTVFVQDVVVQVGEGGAAALDVEQAGVQVLVKVGSGEQLDLAFHLQSSLLGSFLYEG